MTSFTQMLPVRIYYEDTDHGGVVYYANYLKFMERARTEFLRSGGIELDTLERETGAMFAVTEANIHYYAPARFNEEIVIESALTSLRGARLSFHQIARRPSDEKVLVEADVRLACVDRLGKAKRIPVPVKEVLKKHLTFIRIKENS